MKEFILPENVRDGIIQYLVSRPYAEVAEGVAALSRLKPVETHGDEKSPKPDDAPSL